MSLLSIIQSHARLHAISVPSSVIGSTDTNTLQLYEILNEVLGEIVTESKFNVTTQEATHTLIASQDQGALATLCPNGYQFAIFETFYDRTLMRPLVGPLTESEWQSLMALPAAGPLYRFRILQDHLLIDPVPAAPFSLIAWEYMSSWCVKSSAGTLKAAMSADDDVFVFPENILKRGLSYRWKQIKGLPYQADETAYWNMLNNYIAKDKVKRRINVGEIDRTARPGIMVPMYSWNV